jgi:hypothetical protein
MCPHTSYDSIHVFTYLIRLFMCHFSNTPKQKTIEERAAQPWAGTKKNLYQLMFLVLNFSTTGVAKHTETNDNRRACCSAPQRPQHARTLLWYYYYMFVLVLCVYVCPGTMRMSSKESGTERAAQLRNDPSTHVHSSGTTTICVSWYKAYE